MLSSWLVLAFGLTYLLALFAIAYYADHVAKAGTNPGLISNSYIYSLSIAVYCTSWTYYGSVGRAATSGIGFLPIYLGPTIVFALGWFLLRKILRICKSQRITSIADFIASRYGKSQLIAGAVTLIAVFGIIPYISLQLKAVAVSFGVVLSASPNVMSSTGGAYDVALVVTLALAVFSVLFGTRHIEATEHHAGMVVAIAVESIVKLIAFLAVGAFVTYIVYDGFGDIFSKAASNPELAKLMTMEKAGTNWLTLILLSMAAIVCLPRQFHVTFVENTSESHLKRATWLFPLYLLAINIFVLPIAFAGKLTFAGQPIDADTYVLAFPAFADRPMLTLFVLLGGLSAAAAMVIVETIALATMVCNDLIMPALFKFMADRLAYRQDLTRLLLNIRRTAIVAILLLSYLYLTAVGDTYHLVTIGLVSFCAAAQLAPVILFAIFWRGGTRNAAFAGLVAGFIIWFYTLVLPSFAKSGLIPMSFVDVGPLGISILKPYALFGLEGLDNISHALFWSMVFNVGAFLTVAMRERQSRIEHIQATVFVEAFSQEGVQPVYSSQFERGGASVDTLRQLAVKFVGAERTEEAFAGYARRLGIQPAQMTQADSGLMRHVERLIAGTIGSASARVAMASAVRAERLSLEEIMEVLDETSHVLEYSRQLEQKSRQLEIATRNLETANDQLREADRLKDEFMSTVSHELRTPLTSIRSFSEILQDDPEMPEEQRNAFLGIIVSESERLTRLINQVLDLAKIEAGRMQWRIKNLDLAPVVREATQSLMPIFDRDGVALNVSPIAPDLPPVRADGDRLIQVLINLISNAEKFCPKPGGKVDVVVRREGDMARISVIDNGPGIPDADRAAIFDKFYQVKDQYKGDGNPLGTGTGLGLAISERIVTQFGGKIWVDPVTSGTGSDFTFTIPLAVASAPAAQTPQEEVAI